MSDFLNGLMDPTIIWVVIPVVAIIGYFVSKGLKAHYAHQERMARIESGLNPDDE